MIALISGLTASARSIAASTSSAGLASPERTSSACAVASRMERSPGTPAILLSFPLLPRQPLDRLQLIDVAEVLVPSSGSLHRDQVVDRGDEYRHFGNPLTL